MSIILFLTLNFKNNKQKNLNNIIIINQKLNHSNNKSKI